MYHNFSLRFKTVVVLFDLLLHNATFELPYHRQKFHRMQQPQKNITTFCVAPFSPQINGETLTVINYNNKTNFLKILAALHLHLKFTLIAFLLSPCVLYRNRNSSILHPPRKKKTFITQLLSASYNFEWITQLRKDASEMISLVFFFGARENAHTNQGCKF